MKNLSLSARRKAARQGHFTHLFDLSLAPGSSEGPTPGVGGVRNRPAVGRGRCAGPQVLTCNAAGRMLNRSHSGIVRRRPSPGLRCLEGLHGSAVDRATSLGPNPSGTSLGSGEATAGGGGAGPDLPKHLDEILAQACQAVKVISG